MLKTKILNPLVLSLAARVRHTNALVIADAAFPFWPQIETVDISLMENIPTVLDILSALQPEFQIIQAYMALEFKQSNGAKTRENFARGFGKIPLTFESHIQFKKRVPRAIGLIRTGDTTPYGNIILVSG